MAKLTNAQKQLRQAQREALQAAFETLWRQLGGPELRTEYKFCSWREWPFDYADVEQMVAIEIEGGTWTGGRHTRGKGYTQDCIKYNTATLLGWRIFRFTTDMINGPTPHIFIEPVISLLKGIDK